MHLLVLLSSMLCGFRRRSAEVCASRLRPSCPLSHSSSREILQHIKQQSSLIGRVGVCRFAESLFIFKSSHFTCAGVCTTFNQALCIALTKIFDTYCHFITCFILFSFFKLMAFRWCNKTLFFSLDWKCFVFVSLKSQGISHCCNRTPHGVWTLMEDLRESLTLCHFVLVHGMCSFRLQFIIDDRLK